MSTEILHAVEWPGNPDTPDLEGLLAAMGDAVINVETGTFPHHRTGEPVTEHLIRFDTSQLRNTHAHGWGHRYRFVCSLKPDYERGTN